MILSPKEAFYKISKKADEYLDYPEKIKKSNPKLWKKLKKQFDTGRRIVHLQLFNGLEYLNEQTLRMYLQEYVFRFLKYGPNSYPTSFNVLEPFFLFNSHNSIIELIDEEESYGVSLVDFLDFITEPEFELEEIDFYENIPEGVIYHFTFTTGVDEIDFSNTIGKTFSIGGLSLIRQGNEVSILFQAGESYDKKEAEEYFENRTRESLENSISPYKKSLGLKIENEEDPKVVNFMNNEELWLHSVSVLFDIESKSMDIRHVARDENISYTVITDDFNAFFSKDENITQEKINETISSIFEQLDDYNAVFDFAKYCLALPYFVFEKEEKIVDVTYNTSLSEIMKGPFTKREFSSVPKKYKIFAKPFYYLESQYQFVIENKELSDDSFKFEKTGFWKRIEHDELGFDKKGREIFGKTWVERIDSYYTNRKGITTASLNSNIEYDNENAGHIYIMRQPTHEEGIFKVGLTRREPETRRNELSNTSTADKFFIICSYKVKDCVIAEKQIHEDLKKFRITSRREFFRCDLNIIIESCKKITQTINNE
jgi:hypothetical protein